MTRVCVTGASGFIGHHLCRYLRGKGYWVRGVDWRPPRHFGDDVADEQWWDCDLRRPGAARAAVEGVDEVYALAADMGGAGYLFVERFDWEILRNNTLINIHTLRACEQAGVGRVLFTSSACVYATYKQDDLDAAPLQEDDVWPAMPDHIYGWEKLAAERMYQAFGKATGTPVRICRFHNIMGPEEAWGDGREKVPAAACRKVAVSKLTGQREVEVWGDGQQIRSFCYVDDCVEMVYRLMRSDYDEPINIGTDEAVSINDVFLTAAHHAGIDVDLVHIDGPTGVRARNADLTRMRQVMGYEPQVAFREGLGRVYDWVERQVIETGMALA